CLNYKIGEDTFHAKPFAEQIDSLKLIQIGNLKMKKWLLELKGEPILPEDWIKPLSK
ncbi:MAG: hypothetical protein RLZZ292_3421, partial [Bacteroidota bacterium]